MLTAAAPSLHLRAAAGHGGVTYEGLTLHEPDLHHKVLGYGMGGLMW